MADMMCCFIPNRVAVLVRSNNQLATKSGFVRTNDGYICRTATGPVGPPPRRSSSGAKVCPRIAEVPRTSKNRHCGRLKSA